MSPSTHHMWHVASMNLLLCRWYAFGCSHGGDVVCVDGASGQPVWRTRLEDRANTGMALTGDLQVCVQNLSMLSYPSCLHLRCHPHRS